MLRTAILLTLIAATLFGPLLCCCALNLGCPTPVEQQPAKVAGACPHCPPAEPASPKPAPPKHDCPVCAERMTTTNYVEVKPAPVPDAPAFVAWLPLDPAPSVVPAAAPGMGDLPFPDARTYLLDSCHRLRC